MNDQAIRLHNEALRLMPEGASHDASLCPICTDQASSASETPPAESRSGVTPTDPNLATEGGKQQHMDTMTQETHDALVAQAVERATEEASARITELEEAVSTLTGERDSAQTEVANLQEENKRLNGELDTAQVELKSAQDENAQLKSDIEERDEKARLTDIANQRAQQVRNLGLFSEEQIADKAQRWAAVSEEDWAERLDEWKAVRGEAPPPTPEGKDEQASSMSGSSEADHAANNGKPKSARRAVLGLD